MSEETRRLSRSLHCFIWALFTFLLSVSLQSESFSFFQIFPLFSSLYYYFHPQWHRQISLPLGIQTVFIINCFVKNSACCSYSAILKVVSYHVSLGSITLYSLRGRQVWNKRVYLQNTACRMADSIIGHTLVDALSIRLRSDLPYTAKKLMES